MVQDNVNVYKGPRGLGLRWLLEIGCKNVGVDSELGENRMTC